MYLVFEGGGVKGVGLAGAYGALEEEGWEPRCVVGASAGAITAALVAAGYSGAELREEVLALQFREFKHEAWEDRIPIIGKQMPILRDYGVYKGPPVPRVDDREAGSQGRDNLRRPRADRPRRPEAHLPLAGHRLGRQSPRDADPPTRRRADRLRPEKLSIACALRMSMSIPIFFEPVNHSNNTTGAEHLIVEAACCRTSRPALRRR
jgi:NTE family protein